MMDWTRIEREMEGAINAARRRLLAEGMPTNRPNMLTRTLLELQNVRPTIAGINEMTPVELGNYIKQAKKDDRSKISSWMLVRVAPTRKSKQKEQPVDLPVDLTSTTGVARFERLMALQEQLPTAIAAALVPCFGKLATAIDELSSWMTEFLDSVTPLLATANQMTENDRKLGTRSTASSNGDDNESVLAAFPKILTPHQVEWQSLAESVIGQCRPLRLGVLGAHEGMQPVVDRIGLQCGFDIAVPIDIDRNKQSLRNWADMVQRIVSAKHEAYGLHALVILTSMVSPPTRRKARQLAKTHGIIYAEVDRPERTEAVAKQFLRTRQQTVTAQASSLAL